jgi:hypothetical protein
MARDRALQQAIGAWSSGTPPGGRVLSLRFALRIEVNA